MDTLQEGETHSITEYTSVSNNSGGERAESQRMEQGQRSDLDRSSSIINGGLAMSTVHPFVER